METKTNQNQIVITTGTENEKQKLPVNLLVSLAAGAIAGMAIIFGLFWGRNAFKPLTRVQIDLEI